MMKICFATLLALTLSVGCANKMDSTCCGGADCAECPKAGCPVEQAKKANDAKAPECTECEEAKN